MIPSGEKKLTMRKYFKKFCYENHPNFSNLDIVLSNESNLAFGPRMVFLSLSFMKKRTIYIDRSCGVTLSRKKNPPLFPFAF